MKRAHPILAPQRSLLLTPQHSEVQYWNSLTGNGRCSWVYADLSAHWMPSLRHIQLVCWCSVSLVGFDRPHDGQKSYVQNRYFPPWSPLWIYTPSLYHKNKKHYQKRNLKCIKGMNRILDDAPSHEISLFSHYQFKSKRNLNKKESTSFKLKQKYEAFQYSMSKHPCLVDHNSITSSNFTSQSTDKRH